MVHVTQVGRGQAVGISTTWISGTPQKQADGPAPPVGRTATVQPGQGHGGQAAPTHPPEDQELVPVHGDCSLRLSAKRTGGGGGRFPVRLAAVRQ